VLEKVAYDNMLVGSHFQEGITCLSRQTLVVRLETRIVERQALIYRTQQSKMRRLMQVQKQDIGISLSGREGIRPGDRE
jgi:hypothetical protein